MLLLGDASIASLMAGSATAGLPIGVPMSPGKADMQRCHLTTQHTTRPVATPWPP